MQQPEVDARQQQLEQQASEVQHLQQEVARLRQERDTARLQISGIASKQAVNRKSGGAPSSSPSWVNVDLMLDAMLPADVALLSLWR